MKHEYINVMLSTVLGSVSWLLGGITPLIITLLIVMGSDFVVATIKAIKKKKFSPSVLLWGFVGKSITFLPVIVINSIQTSFSLNIPLRDIVISVLILNNIASFLKHYSYFDKSLQPFAGYFETIKIKLLKIIEVGDGDE